LFMKMRFYSSKIVNYSAKRKNKNHHW
jgi:hypothetical protein